MTQMRSVLLSGLLLICGCTGKPKEQLPQVYPVRGKVLLASGALVNGGGIEFQSVEDDTIRAFGRILNGEFTLKTSTATQGNIDGAQAGKYRVTLHPDQNESQIASTITLPEVIEIKADDSNDLRIILPR